MCSDKTTGSILFFVALVEDNPLELAGDDDADPNIQAMAQLVMLASTRMLNGSIATTSFTTMTSAAPQIAAARLLNMLCVRLQQTKSKEIRSILVCLETVCSILGSLKALGETLSMVKSAARAKTAAYGRDAVDLLAR